MYLKETDWEGVHLFASVKGQLVGFCESDDEISFPKNAGNYLTSLGTNIFALQERVCYTGVTLYGTPVHNPKPPVNFAATLNRYEHPSDKTKSQQCHNSLL